MAVSTEMRLALRSRCAGGTSAWIQSRVSRSLPLSQILISRRAAEPSECSRFSQDDTWRPTSSTSSSLSSIRLGAGRRQERCTQAETGFPGYAEWNPWGQRELRRPTQ
jgi:hypothetical protein